MKITEIYSIIKPFKFAREVFINLKELDNFLDNNRVEMEECIILPFYIQNNKYMELYEFEFFCTNELSFEEFILKKTGNKKVDDVPKDILSLRRNCFSTPDDVTMLPKYVKFLIGNNQLRKEIENTFSEYEVSNLFIAIY